MTPKIYPLCETALTIEWGNRIDGAVQQRVMALHYMVRENPFPGFIETVPAYTTLTVYYQPQSSSFDFVKKYLISFLDNLTTRSVKDERIVSVPVCYDEEFGYDLESIAQLHQLTKEQVIDLHQQQTYHVYMMGFLPGFAYMGSIDDAIATPRKATPRAIVEEGSVGIAGKQTGIYPLASPGGWQILGRTPLRLFDLQQHDPFLLKTGDTIQFNAISKVEFYTIKNEPTHPVEIVTDDSNADAIIIKPGVYSTIQDAGRFGYQSYGVPISGAMDQSAFYTANALAGNIQHAACIECTMAGLQIQFRKNAVIAVTGAGIALVNGRPIKSWQPLSVFKNDVLEIKYNNEGIRTYVAVRGGFAVNPVMNSRSAYPKAGIGSPLKKEGRLQFGEMVSANSKRITENLSLPQYSGHALIRVIAGHENEWMNAESREKLYTQDFFLSNQCDRMGYHLKGDALTLTTGNEMISTAVTKGTVQLTPSGQLIVLMNDCQTIGGYPRVAQVAAVDLAVLAQLKPGDNIRFMNISFEEAEELYLSEQKMIDAFFN